ncbi:hypothetical protein QOZ80_4BG0356750 [Eleusine coracana subsp. coracana]|nr:hypothetical protein QOZ80_4BG0356750 [Eleusine coracana subsp. coracana]
MAKVVVLDELAVDSPTAKAFLTAVPFILVFAVLRYYVFAGATATRSTRSRATSKLKLPPSPPALPLIGHAHLVGALPHVSLRRLAARHGGEGLMLLRLGVVPTLVASSPRAAQAVLRAHDQSLASRPRSVCGDVLTYGPSDVAMAPYGERWRRAKMLVTTHLLSARKVQSYRDAREEEVRLVIDEIQSAASVGAVVDMSKLLSKFTNDMVCRAVAGRSFRVEGRDRVFRELIDQGMTLLGGFNLDNFYPRLAKIAGGVLVWTARRKAQKTRRRWDQLLDKLINEHDCDVAGSDQQDSDFIHVLLSVKEEYGLTRDNMKAILVNMFAAGTDTAYLVLEFAMAELMRHRDVMARLQQELRSCTNDRQNFISEVDLTGMTYLKAVIKETLRLHPPSPLLLPHFSVQDCEVDGYAVPAATTVLVNAWAIGQDPKIWDAAEEFIPERFSIEGNIGGVDFRGKDFQFLPFGSGRRMCPGMNFALAAIEIMLANLVYHFDWELPKGVDHIDMTEVFGLTVSRKEKLLLAPRLRGILCTQ